MTNTEINSIVRNTENPNEDPYTGKNQYGYTIGEKLGEGGVGVVYVGVNDKGEKVAIKFLKEEKPEFVSALRKEARIQQNIDDPGLLKVLEVHDKAIITEYEEGMKALDVENLTPYDLPGIALQIIDTLERLHSKGIIHSDIKPGNILVTKDGNVKIADCGLAKIILEHSNLANTVASVMSVHKNGWEGTPSYLPGNLDELKEPAPSLDVYEFGKVLYQMIMGSPRKFPGMGSLPKLKKACSDKGLPGLVADFVAQMTEEDKEDRIQDIAQLKRTEGYREIDKGPVLRRMLEHKVKIRLEASSYSHNLTELYARVKYLYSDSSANACEHEFTELVCRLDPKKIRNPNDADLAISMICAYLENSIAPEDTDKINSYKEKMVSFEKKFSLNSADRMARLNLFLEHPVSERKEIGVRNHGKYVTRINQAKSKKELDEIRIELNERVRFINDMVDKSFDFEFARRHEQLCSETEQTKTKKEIEDIIDRTLQTIEYSWEKFKLSLSGGAIAAEQYVLGAGIGMLAGLPIDGAIQQYSSSQGGFSFLSSALGLAGVMGLRAYASKVQAKCIKENKPSSYLIDFLAGLSNCDLKPEDKEQIQTENETGEPKPFAKKIKDAASKALEHLVENKISHLVQTHQGIAEVFLPQEQIKAIKESYKESEKTEQPAQESLPEPKESEQPKITASESKLPEPMAPVQETYKQPEQPIPVKEEPTQILQSPVQEQEEDTEEDEDEEPKEKRRMLES